MDTCAIMAVRMSSTYLLSTYDRRRCPNTPARTVYQHDNRLNALLQAKGQQPLKQWVIDKTMQQLKESQVDGTEAMTVQRLKNIYGGSKDPNSIDAFIPYIEKQRGQK